MLFDQLSSEVIKAGLISKLQFSLGYRMIAAHIKSQLPPKMDFETKAIDDTPMLASQLAKRKFSEFQRYAQTHSYQVSELSEIVQSYMKSSTKQVQHASADIVALRARISGISQDTVALSATKQTELAQAKLDEKCHKVLIELSDIDSYNDSLDTEMNIDEIILDQWVAENYPKVVKSQIAYWSRYNNWNDAELIFIEEDTKLLETSNI